MASAGSVIQNVVVDQRRGVDHFDHSRKRVGRLVCVSRNCFLAQQKQDRTNLFALKLTGVLQDVAHVLVRTVQLLIEDLIHLKQITAD